MHFTKPTAWYNMWSWKSQVTLFLTLITLEHSRGLTIVSVAKMHALSTSQGSDGQLV